MCVCVCVCVYVCVQAMKETKGFSASDWHKAFTVTFIGEEGEQTRLPFLPEYVSSLSLSLSLLSALDWGGVSREFFHLLCTQCFNCSNGMFRRFKDDSQALVSTPHYITQTNCNFYFQKTFTQTCF